MNIFLIILPFTQDIPLDQINSLRFRIQIYYPKCMEIDISN